MEMLTKLRNTVSTTVSQLSGVLPGNPVTREFEATRHIASAGPGLLWKIYDGHKKSTKQEAAIFVLEKRQLERYTKRERDSILDSLRRGVAQMTRLRHPKILTVQHPLEESRESLAFATEPIFASLANVLGYHENMPSHLPTELNDFKLFEVEIKYGILQICEALAFLHGDVRLLHRSLSPESIIINKSGSWKLSGFEFCIQSTSSSSQPASWPFHEWEADVHPHAQPPLAHLAPEYALTLSCDASSDMFSLGSVIYAVFNGGKTLMGNGNTFSVFKKHCCELKSLTIAQLGGIPSEAREHVKLLLNVTPELRPDAHQFSKIPFFEDVGAKTLEYLDSLFQWDNLQKSQFYKGLPNIITKMPKRVNLYRIIPCLAKEFVNPEMVPFVLPSVLLIAEDASKQEFCQSILPELRPIFKLQEPVQILLIFMQKMELLLSKTPTDDIKIHVLPMVYRALESDTHQIQELCLNILPNFANLVDYPSMKNALIPRIKKLCLTTQFLSVRVNCLVCLGKLLEHLDKWLVLDDILPMLPEVQSREPAVLMGILGIYKLAMSHKKLGITKDVMATKVIPFLMPLSIENGLSLNQFNAVIGVVKEMVNHVEVDHRAKLEQLNSMQHEQRTSLEMSKVHMPNKNELISGVEMKPLSDTDQLFQGLGLGSYVAEKDVSKTASEFLPSAVSPAEKPRNPISNNTLTLEEKERIAREQERQQRLNKQTVLQPEKQQVKVTLQQPMTCKAAPRDLTDTLINSNIANLRLGSAPSQSVTPNYNISHSFNANPSFPAFPGPSATVLPVAAPLTFQPTPSAGQVNSFQSSNVDWGQMAAYSNLNQMTSYGNTNIPTLQPPPTSTTPLRPPQWQQNPSSLDNLLVSSSHNVQKLTMNQMTNQKAFPQYQSNFVQNSAPQLSAVAVPKIIPPPQSSASNDLSDLLG